MNVLLCDIDGGWFPNLALMKLSAWHKRGGDTVWLDDFPDGSRVDRVYIACVFQWNREKALKEARWWREMGIDVVLGGYPLNKTRVLPDEIEHIMPDYSLYDLDYSIGFASRGCFRGCEFCIVSEKEGNRVVHNASIHEFLHPDHSILRLLDNNILGSPKWKFTFDEILDAKVGVEFNQGIDIRLVNEDNAKYLGEIPVYKSLKIAFDKTDYKEELINGVGLLIEHGVKVSALQCYTLVGYNTSFDEDMERLAILRDLGVKCYPTFYKQPSGRKEGVKCTGDLEVFFDCLPVMSPIGVDMLARHYGFIKGREKLVWSKD